MKKTIFISVISFIFSLNLIAQDLSPMEMYKKGEFFEKGMFGAGAVGVDFQKAFSWYLKSAETGFVSAQNMVGSLYEEGKGVKKNYQKAFYWYKKSAEQNDNHAQSNNYAQTNLATLYQNGKGCKLDLQKAIYWYEKAANSGFSIAQYNLGNLYDKNKEFKKAIIWYKKAIESGDISEAQVNLGSIYLYGKGNVEADYYFAFELFKKAANKSQRIGQYKLARCYENGWGTQVNIDKAIFWYKKSANQGLSAAQKELTKLGF